MAAERSDRVQKRVFDKGQNLRFFLLLINLFKSHFIYKGINIVDWKIIKYIACRGVLLVFYYQQSRRTEHPMGSRCCAICVAKIVRLHFVGRQWEGHLSSHLHVVRLPRELICAC